MKNRYITWVLFLTLIIRTERGPVLNSSSSFFPACEKIQMSLGILVDVMKSTLQSAQRKTIQFLHTTVQHHVTNRAA